MKAWHELVHEFAKEHNGVMGVRLFFGHDGVNSCSFESYDKVLATGESGRSMQEGVECCIDAFNRERSIQNVADHIMSKSHLTKAEIVSIIRNGLFSGL